MFVPRLDYGSNSLNSASGLLLRSLYYKFGFLDIKSLRLGQDDPWRGNYCLGALYSCLDPEDWLEPSPGYAESKWHLRRFSYKIIFPPWRQGESSSREYMMTNLKNERMKSYHTSVKNLSFPPHRENCLFLRWKWFFMKI